MHTEDLPPSKTMYDVWERLGAIDAKLDALTALPDRVSKLENSRAFDRGATAVIGAIFGWVASLIPKHIGLS